MVDEKEQSQRTKELKEGHKSKKLHLKRGIFLNMTKLSLAKRTTEAKPVEEPPPPKIRSEIRAGRLRHRGVRKVAVRVRGGRDISVRGMSISSRRCSLWSKGDIKRIIALLMILKASLLIP